MPDTTTPTADAHANGQTTVRAIISTEANARLRQVQAAIEMRAGYRIKRAEAIEAAILAVEPEDAADAWLAHNDTPRG